MSEKEFPTAPIEPQPHTDGSLLRRMSAGESDAATELYHRYATRLYTMARLQCGADLSARFDPEDILQSVFRTFFRRASQGDYDLPDDENLWKLLLVTTLNKVRAKGAYHRAQMRDVRHTKQGPVADVALRQALAQEEVALLELRMAIGEILSTMPESQRVIIECRMDGDKVSEIAAKTKRSKRTIERAIQDFCGIVRKEIEKES